MKLGEVENLPNEANVETAVEKDELEKEKKVKDYECHLLHAYGTNETVFKEKE